MASFGLDLFNCKMSTMVSAYQDGFNDCRECNLRPLAQGLNAEQTGGFFFSPR